MTLNLDFVNNFILAMYYIQAIQIYCIQTVYMLVLGLAWKEHACHFTQLYCEQDTNEVSVSRWSIHRIQVSTTILVYFC